MKHESRDSVFVYNAGTDLLMNWGCHLLERPEFHIEHDELNVMLSYWSSEDLIIEVEAVLPFLFKNTEIGRQFLIKNPTISSDNQNESWDISIDTMSTFDELLFLYYAISENVKEMPPNLFLEIETAYMKLSEWIEKGENFSALRLVSINKWRQKRLEDIPIENHYLYPWYTDLSELPSDTIDLLIEQWGNIQTKGFTAFSAFPEPNRTVIWSFLNQDIGLQNSIAEKHLALNKILETMKSFSVRLLSLSFEARLSRRVKKEEYFNMGLKKITATIIGNNIQETITDSMIRKQLDCKDNLENLLLSAYCGAGLSDQQRIDIFENIEHILNQAVIFDKMNSSEVFGLLQLWVKKEISDYNLSENFFLIWEKLRKDAYEKIKEDKDENIDLDSQNTKLSEDKQIDGLVAYKKARYELNPYSEINVPLESLITMDERTMYESTMDERTMAKGTAHNNKYKEIKKVLDIKGKRLSETEMLIQFDNKNISFEILNFYEVYDSKIIVHKDVKWTALDVNYKNCILEKDQVILKNISDNYFFWVLNPDGTELDDSVDYILNLFNEKCELNTDEKLEGTVIFGITILEDS